MSGPHASHRTPNRPLFTGSGEPVYKEDKHGIVLKWVTVPGEIYKDGRCVDWRHYQVPVQRHVLAPAFEAYRPSKHSRGRIRPRTAAERRRAASLTARGVRASKSITLLVHRQNALLVA